jgi:general secretion pathway protein G
MARHMRSGSVKLGRRLKRGFSFLEMLVVVTIIGILMTIAIPIYNKTITRSKESVLKQNLFTLRTVIDNYTYDKMKAPQQLEDLVREGYLRALPVDPITGSNSTWQVEMEEAGQSVDQSQPGIYDVKSGSETTSPLEGTAYSQW